MFARLWWQALVLGETTESGPVSFALLNALSESDLNQLLERRSIGGNPILARAAAKALIGREDPRVQRRDLVRDVTRRLQRRLAYIDFLALDEEQVLRHCLQVVDESLLVLGS
jgi:hypothetical protein